MILICIVLTVTNVAAIWAWRLAEASLDKARMDRHTEFLRANKAAKEFSSAMNELRELRSQRLDDASSHADELNKTRQRMRIQEEEIAQLRSKLGGYELHNETREGWRKQLEHLQNEIDGLNVDKLYLKSKLTEFETKFAKSRAQKTEAMRRLRAKKKEQNTPKK